jgi:ribosomal subunit interface protein
MPLQVTSDNLEVTPSMKALAESKIDKILSKLEDLPEDQVDTRIVLNKGEAEGTFVVKIQLDIGTKTIVGEDFEYSLESALIKAVDDTLRQFQKERSKKNSEEWKKRRDMKIFKDEEDA